MREIVNVVAVFVIIIGSVAADYHEQPAPLQPAPLQQGVIRTKRSYDRWLDIISQYARRGGGEGANTFQPFPVDLPITGKDGRQSSLPLLVLPFPIPVPDFNAKQECSANNGRDTSNRQRENNYRNREENKEDRYKVDRYKEDRPREDRPREDRYRGDRPREDRFREDRYREDRYKEDKYREDRYKEEKNRYKDDRYQEDKIRYKENDNRNGNRNYDVRVGNSNFGQDDSFGVRQSAEKVSSDYLIEIFKKQQPTAPDLPPALIGYAPEITYPTLSTPRGFSNRQYLPPSDDDDSPPSPPKFDRSMVVRGFLTVHKADYTEPYTAWYDARSGSSRVEYHEGGTTCYRTMMSGGRVKRSMTYTDRTEEKEVAVCGVTSPSRASPEDRDAPALPNTEGFSFAGYKEEFGVRAESWKREVRGRPGELGGARGEALVYHHELLVHRRGDGFNVPLRYKVAVDSSVLGSDCDGYEHIYSEVREKEHDEDEFNFNTDRQCDTVEQMDSNNPEDMARLDPIKEFSLPQRDPRYDTTFEVYIKEYERSYIDVKEEAMRKNILVQHARFVSSCNRQSATFVLGTNFLSDRLAEEVEGILGVSFTAEFENNTVSFPISEDRLSRTGRKQPSEFDWRPKGAVSSVKFQGVSCSSCWAFAVTGSVEGALFVKTKQFVELSVQCLVDCAVSHGAHGCNKIGTWPVHAYNYIRDRGIPANDEYAPYDAMDHNCKAPPSTPTTHIQGGVDVPPNDIDALKVAIRRFAPSVLVVDAKPQTFISYKKGVMRDDRCIKAPKKKLNHAVLAVGWGEQRGAPHFIIKNSWSAAWGDAGYIRLHAPSNTCGHLTTPSFALLKRSDVDKPPGGAGGQGRARGGDSGEDDDDYDDRR